MDTTMAALGLLYALFYLVLVTAGSIAVLLLLGHSCERFDSHKFREDRRASEE